MIYTYKSSFVLLLSHFLVTISTANIDKVVSMLFSQRQWTYVDSTFLFNQISTLKQYWIDVIYSMLFQRCFVNIQTTSVKICWLKFHFQPNFNVETTLVHQPWINVVSTLFCQRWNNVDKSTSAQLSFSTKYQRWNNVDELWWSMLFQRWVNVDVLAGNFLKS